MSNPVSLPASAAVQRAVSQAARAKAHHDSGLSTRALGELARAFPALAETFASPDQFDTSVLARWARRAEREQQERDCAAFVLHVANPRADWGAPFDIMTVMERWSEVDRAVFVEWAQHPWWCA